MLKSNNITTTLILLLFFCLTSLSIAQPPVTKYQHFTDFEVTRFNEIIWFWTMDTLYGPVHSNDFIGLKYSPHFYGQVSTTRDEFRLYSASPYFEFEPIFNADYIPLPEEYPHLRERAVFTVEPDFDNNMTMTVIQFNGEDGIDVSLKRVGGGDADTLIEHLDEPERSIIFVDGEVEIEGILSGILTVYSSGNMWLTDNIIYLGADERTGWFDGEETPHMLGLVSERNILIKNNVVNGRENGWDQAPNNFDRHSIAINAHLQALDQSFTFEHQNDEDDQYQGPEPDERGYIYLTGGVAQRRRGYTHRSNHYGTGYRKSYHFDSRLLTTGPPGFAPGEFPWIVGEFDDLILEYEEYEIANASIENLQIGQGVNIKVMGQLTIRNSLIIEGAEQAPVVFERADPDSDAVIIIERGDDPMVNLSHVVFSVGIEIQCNSNEIVIYNSQFGSSVSFDGDAEIQDCFFRGQTTLGGTESIEIQKNVFIDGLIITGDVSNGLIFNNTISGSDEQGILLDSFNSLTLYNNIISFNRIGIRNSHDGDLILRYNNVFSNNPDYIDCEAGEGSISSNPRYIAAQDEDFHLMAQSPCIDAGDPDSPLDPDTTQADMGAFYFDQALEIIDGEIVPGNFELDVFPNPFNSSLNVAFLSNNNQDFEWKLYDIKGSLVKSGSKIVNQGLNKVILDSKIFQTSGVYFLKMSIGETNLIEKVVYLP